MSDEDPKKIISSALISSPKGVTLFRLMRDYREFTGQDPPYRKMGFPSFEHYLHTIPETCRIVGCGREALVIPVVNEQNKHINEMILKQKPPKANTRSGVRNIRRSRGIYDSSALYPSNVPIHRPKPKPEPEPEIDFKLPDLAPNSHLRVLPPPADYFKEMQEQKTKEPPKPVKKPVSLDSDKVFNEMHQDIVAALSEESDFDEYFDEIDFDNNDDDFYYKSDCDSVDLSTEIPSQEISIPMLDPDEHSRPDHVSRINDNIKEKLRVLISEYPDGIWCSKLLKIYRERFKQPLDPLHFGFSSVIQLCDDVPDIFHCIRPNRTDWKLYDSRKPVPDVHSMRDLAKYLQSLAIVDHNSVNTEPALPNNLGSFNPSYKYPESVLHPDERIERIKLPDDDQIDEFIEMNVAEVYDPSKFWIQLKGENLENLEALMDKMQIFYMHNAGTLQLNEFSVRIGLFVAALFLNEYHRAVVIKVFSDQTLKVFYVDYGTVGEVSLQKTCLLHRDFCWLPQQAIRARLDNIVPIDQNTMWPREAAQFMLNMVMDKTLFGLLRRIDKDQQILHIILTDTTQDFDIHINDELVNSGYAALGNEAPMCSTSSATVANVHLYPSFDELENAIYPSVSDMIHLLKLGQTYEKIYHGYFNQSGYTHTPEYLHISPIDSRCGNQSETDPSFIEEEIVEEDEAEDEDEEEEIVVEQLNQNTNKPPPGFETIKPNVDNFSHNATQVVPVVNPFFQNYTNDQLMNQSAMLQLALINPLIYNQMLFQREILLQQQRETLLNQQRNALFQHQFEEFQRIIANKNKPSTSDASNSTTPSPKNMYDHFVDNSNKNTKNVIELKLDNFTIHVIKLENEYYIVSQEIISTLLKSDLSLKNWLIQNDLSFCSFPNMLINLSNHEDVYSELIKFNVPGVYKATNLGCNIRITLLNDVIGIVNKYGDQKIIPELRNNIKNVTESAYLWEILHSSD